MTVGMSNPQDAEVRWCFEIKTFCFGDMALSRGRDYAV